MEQFSKWKVQAETTLKSCEIHAQRQNSDGFYMLKNEVGRACGTRGRGKKRVQGFGGKARRKKQPERPRRRWEDGIKVDRREIGGGGVEWIHLAQDRDRWRAVANAVMNLRVPAPRS
jgi:hypothetical protein